MPDPEDLPDPADIAAYLTAQRGTPLHERMCRFGARYILAGLELALLHQREHPED